jgi:type I restriction enzyme R subunit
LLAPDFLDKLQQHAGGNPRAKASEMEHALRKHCTVHHDEDPAFYKRLSEKVDALIDKHHDQWELLAEKLAEVRDEAASGRQSEAGGMGREAKTFHDFVADLVFDEGKVPEADAPAFRELIEGLVLLLQETIDGIDFWQSPDKQKRLRGQIKLALGKTDMANLKDQRERVAVEVMKLARSRHDALLGKGTAR